MPSSKCRPRNSTGRLWITSDHRINPTRTASARLQQIQTACTRKKLAGTNPWQSRKESPARPKADR